MPKQGSTKERGYSGEHPALRAKLAPEVEAGRVACWRCGLPIAPWQPWDLGHDDHDRRIYRGPEHARKAHCPKGGNRATNRRDRRVRRVRRWSL